MRVNPTKAVNIFRPMISSRNDPIPDLIQRHSLEIGFALFSLSAVCSVYFGRICLIITRQIT